MSAQQRNLLPQALGWAPGTSLIGNFGTTDQRFTRLPMDGTPEPHNPGPGAYAPKTYSSVGKVGNLQPSAARWSWGTGAGHVMNLASGPTPGPGAYGSEQTLVPGILTGLRRQWPGIATKSSFGTNAELPTLKRGADDNGNPGPGRYDSEASTYFTSGAAPVSGARSPYPAQARSVTGSRIQRDVDIKTGANFLSKSPAHVLPFAGQKDGPAPGDHHPTVDTIAHDYNAKMCRLRLRSDCGRETNFDSTASRFPSEEAKAKQPGPGAHTIERWSGELPNPRKPRHITPDQSSTGGKCGFLTSSERFTRAPEAAAQSVVDFLAYGEYGPIGQPVHAQQALRNVADSVRRR